MSSLSGTSSTGSPLASPRFTSSPLETTDHETTAEDDYGTGLSGEFMTYGEVEAEPSSTTPPSSSLRIPKYIFVLITAVGVLLGALLMEDVINKEMLEKIHLQKREVEIGVGGTTLVSFIIAVGMQFIECCRTPPPQQHSRFGRTSEHRMTLAPPFSSSTTVQTPNLGAIDLFLAGGNGNFEASLENHLKATERETLVTEQLYKDGDSSMLNSSTESVHAMEREPLSTELLNKEVYSSMLNTDVETVHAFALALQIEGTFHLFMHADASLILSRRDGSCEVIQDQSDKSTPTRWATIKNTIDYNEGDTLLLFSAPITQHAESIHKEVRNVVRSATSSQDEEARTPLLHDDAPTIQNTVDLFLRRQGIVTPIVILTLS